MKERHCSSTTTSHLTRPLNRTRCKRQPYTLPQRKIIKNVLQEKKQGKNKDKNKMEIRGNSYVGASRTSYRR
jgi:hypothetical protein